MSWLERLFPPRCLFCADPGSDGMAVCPACRFDLPRQGAACVRCGTRLPETAPGLAPLSVCGACLWQPPPYAAIHVAFAYAAPIDWLVRRLKFRGDLAAGRLLGELVARELGPQLPAADTVVPVPLHEQRLIERGFNQSAELARPIARALGAPIAGEALVRSRATVAQMDLPAHRRGVNVRGCFEAARGSAADVVLVDDVVTTAATVREAARRLSAAGAERVTVVAAARA